MKQKVKISGLVLLFLLTTAQAYSQKCKYDYQKKDPITGEELKKISFTVRFRWYLDLNKKGEQYAVGMLFAMQGDIGTNITPENTIIFKLENGDIVTVNANDVYRPTIFAVGSGMFATNIGGDYNISEEDLKKIASSPLIFVRMSIGSLIFEETLSTKKGVSFQNIAKCILQ